MNASKLKYRSHLKRRVQRQALQSSDNDNEDDRQQRSAAVVSPLPEEQRGDLNINEMVQHHQNVESVGGHHVDYDDKMQRAKEIILRRNTPPRRQGGANYVKANDCSTPVNKSTSSNGHQNNVMLVGWEELGGSTRHSPLQQTSATATAAAPVEEARAATTPTSTTEISTSIKRAIRDNISTPSLHPTIPTPHHHHDDNMSLLSTSNTSVLTDEAMDDHKLMVRNVRQWEHRRLMRNSMRQQQVQHQHQQQRGQEYSQLYQNYSPQQHSYQMQHHHQQSRGQSQRQSQKQQIQIWDRLSPILQRREPSMLKEGED